MIETFIYTPKENENEDKKVLRERWYLISILVLALGCLLLILEQSVIGIVFIISGAFLTALSKFSLLTPRLKKTGHFSEKLVITSERILIGSNSITLHNVDYMEIILRSTKGRITGNFNQVWSADGTNNSIKLRMDSCETEFNFLIENDCQYVTLTKMKFPENVKIMDFTTKYDG